MNRTILLDGHKYLYWTAKMRALIISMGMKVWVTITSGWESYIVYNQKSKST